MKAEPKPRYLRNALSAFQWRHCLLIGQALTTWHTMMKVPPKKPPIRQPPLDLDRCPLTGFGVFDQLAKYAGAGLAVPVTGFANSVVSAALGFGKKV